MASFLQALSVIIAALSVAVAAWSATLGVHAWRRQVIGTKRTDVAEKALTAIYEARDILEAARSPMSFGDEGKTRTPQPGETEAQTRHRNSYYAPAERLLEQRDFFMATNASRYRLLAYFGPTAAAPFETIYRARNKVLISTRMLLTMPDRDLRQDQIESLRRWEADIWSIGDANDVIKRDVDAAVAQLEALCRPALAEPPEMPGTRLLHLLKMGWNWARGRFSHE